jgi:hypothetical protein
MQQTFVRSLSLSLSLSLCAETSIGLAASTYGWMVLGYDGTRLCLCDDNGW